MDTIVGMKINIEQIEIDTTILSLIAEIDEFKGAWRALGTLAPDRLSALRHVATIESIGSSTRIEGSKLSDRAVEKLLSKLEIKSFDSRDEQEVAGYAGVMETVFSAWDSITLTENHIKQLHRDLLQYSDKDERHRGEYKTNPNHVSAFDTDGKEIGIVFETASPFESPQRMNDLIKWTTETREQGILHPLLIIAVFIVVFLQIHPFQDGNGRLSRILTMLLLLQMGYAYAPYASLESVIEKSKEGYYVALRQTQKTIVSNSPNWRPWLLYFLRALQKQKNILDAKISRERIVLETLSELSVMIVELIQTHGRLTNSQIVSATGINRNTLKKHLQALVKNGYLKKNGIGKGTWYSRT